MAPHPPLSVEPAGGWSYGSGTGGALAATPLAANAFFASSSRLRAWPGGGCGGALGWTGSLLCMPRPANFGPGPEASGGERSWTGSLLCTPLAAAGPEAAEEGRSAGQGVCFVRL